MTNEELERTMQELSDDIAQLSDTDKPLTKEEKNRRHILLLKKATIRKIKEAREKNNASQEFSHTVTYGLLSTWGEKHPYLMYLLSPKSRINIF